MWQLRERWQAAKPGQDGQGEPVRLPKAQLHGVATGALVVLAGVLCGYLGSRAVKPVSPPVIISWSIGGAALAYLLTVTPRRALRALRQGAVRLRLSLRQRRLRGQARRARRRLLVAVERQPTPDLLRDLGVAEFLAGDVDEAELQLRAALQVSPGSGGLLNDLAVVLAERGQASQAAELFVQALTTDCAEAASLNCALVAPLVNTPETLEAMLRSSGEAPSPLALNNLGVSYARMGQWERAEIGFLAAARHNGGLPEAAANLGLVSLRRGKLQEAADRVTAADRLAPREPAFANYLGVTLARGGQFDLARQYLQRALRADTANPAISNNAMAVEALAGRWEEAARGLNALADTDGASADVHYNLALARLATGDANGATASAGAAIAAGDTSADAHTVLAVALWEAGQRARAMAQFRAATTSTEAGPGAACNLARALLLEGETAAAKELLEKAHLAWPDDDGVSLDLALTRLALTATEYSPELSSEQRARLRPPLQRCRAALEAGVRSSGVHAPEVHVNLGLCLYMMDQFEPAAEHFEQAMRAGAKPLELQFLVGTALAKASEQHAVETADGTMAPIAMGRHLLRRAALYLEQACGAREIMADAAYNLGRCCYLLEDFEGALSAFRKALTVERGEELFTYAGLAAAQQAQELQLLARGHLLMTEAKRDQLRARAQDLLNAAVHYFTQALTRNDMNPGLHGDLGIAYMMRNHEHDIESALRHWERMRAIGGGAMEHRYAELAQIGSASGGTRVAFDDRDLKLRDLAVRRWLAVPPPTPGGLRFRLEPVAVQQPWRMTVGAEDLRRALEMRAQVAADAAALARLRV